nr:MAG TPA: hypothetical protein [Caudoviricetes sp.]
MARHEWLRPTFTRHSEIYFKHNISKCFICTLWATCTYL